ncbi:MAG: RNA 2',3'-cyclic phosphodiesterase [Desulfovibrio sp.]|nr:RNA 2',3'-cyclic phosphodiesterase [Desulfovibrio sp.]
MSINEPHPLIRAFVAILLPEPAQSVLANYLKTLRPLAKLKWVKETQLHITLRFIGEQPKSTILQVKTALQAISFSPFEIELSKIGAYPAPTYPRVLWLAGRNNLKELNDLAEKVNSTLEDILPREKRPFKAHLTLARTHGAPLPEELLQKLQHPPLLSFTCQSFALMQSTLTPNGPLYTKIPLS